MEKISHKTISVSPTISTPRLISQLKAASKEGVKYIFIRLDGYDIDLSVESQRRMLQVARDTDAALLYSDYRVLDQDGKLTPHPLAP